MSHRDLPPRRRGESPRRRWTRRWPGPSSGSWSASKSRVTAASSAARRFREIVYRVLQGEQGGALRALASRTTILPASPGPEASPRRIRPSQFSVEELARKAGMSLAAFHHYFKLVTTCSPLQYLKRIRLDHAKRLIGTTRATTRAPPRGRSGTRARRSSAGSSSGSTASPPPRRPGRRGPASSPVEAPEDIPDGAIAGRG